MGLTEKLIEISSEISEERDLGAMISMLTKAVQQLTIQNEELITRIEILENQ